MTHLLLTFPALNAHSFWHIGSNRARGFSDEFGNNLDGVTFLLKLIRYVCKKKCNLYVSVCTCYS